MVRVLTLPFRKYKFLLYQLTQREIKARYKQSFIGRAWVVVNPLAQLLVYTFVFSFVFSSPSGGIPYPIFLLAGLLPWSLFQGSVTIATNSLVENAPLIRKVSFPREIIPYSVVIAKVIDFTAASVLFLVLALFFKVSLSTSILLVLPLLFLQLILTTGISLLLSAFNLFYRDVQYLANLVLMLWMYMTPIVYPTSLVPSQFLTLYNLNPMVGIIEGYRSAVFGLPFNLYSLWWSIVISILVFSIAYIVFKKVEKVFADIA